MRGFLCDYACRTVGESIAKYKIPGGWCAEFDACDGVWPVICIRVDQIIKSPAMMDLKLKIVENKDDEYAGCMVCKESNTIAFKVEHMSDLVEAMKETGLSYK